MFGFELKHYKVTHIMTEPGGGGGGHKVERARSGPRGHIWPWQLAACTNSHAQ